MNPMPLLSLFLAAPDPHERSLYRECIQKDDRYSYDIVESDGLADLRRHLSSRTPDLILVELGSLRPQDLVILAELQQTLSPASTGVIVVSASEDLDIRTQVMQHGAHEYLVKRQLTLELLRHTIHATVERVRLARQLEECQKQQRLIAAIALRIHQSLPLVTLFQETVRDIQQILRVDRVLVYQFYPDMSGTIVAESVLPEWTAMLGTQVVQPYFQELSFLNVDPSQSWAIDDIDQAELTDEHVQQLEHWDVKASLVVPIIVDTVLWGVLMAHQCSAPRRWYQQERNWFVQVAIHLAIAIHHASIEQQAFVLFDGNPIPMWVYDLETLAFLAVNDAAIAKYGYSEAEFLRMTIADIRPPEDILRLLENVHTVQTGFNAAGIWRHYLKDGRLIQVEITSSMIQFAGRWAELVMVQDVTAYQQSEQELRESVETETERGDRQQFLRMIGYKL
jgi:PAS domain S-box-containing protein